MSKSREPVFDVIVVGAGVVGSATAYQLGKAGYKTLLLEQFSLGHTRGSSSGSSRIIRKIYAEQHYAEMMPECFQFWADLEKEAGTKLLKQVGLLWVEGGDTARLNQYETVMKHQEASYRYFRSDSKLRAQYRMFQFPEGSRAILDPSASSLNAKQCAKALQDMSRKYGVTILDNTRVNNIYVGMRTQVATSQGDFRCAHVVLCPGPWSQSLLKKVGLNIPLKVVQGFQYYWRVKSQGEFSPETTPIMVDEDDGMFKYSFPSDERPGYIKVGTRGEALVVPVDPDHPEDHPENERRVREHMSRYVRRVMPGLEDKPSIVEPCLYTFSPDYEYILDRHPKYKTVIIAAGMSGHGFKAAPMVGKMVAEMVAGKPTSYDISHYSVKRFRKKQQASSKL